MNRIFVILPATLMTIWMITGCSSSHHSNPITAPNLNDEISSLAPDLPISDVSEASTNRILWGIWDVMIDVNAPNSDSQGDAPNPAAQQGFTIFPHREPAYHFNVTPLIPPPTMVIKSYNSQTRIISIDFTITNPYQISGYDVRLIVYTDALGHKLINADDWTSLYDIPGGLPINPFKAYAKDQTNRRFQGLTQHTENFKIYLPDGDFNLTIEVDASYPTNCEEPYELTNFTQGIILDQLGSSTELEVTAHSWSNDVNSVKLYCPQITGTSLVSFHQIDSEKWGYTLTNNAGATSGNYFGYLIATTSKSGSLALYDEVTIKITPENGGWARTWGGMGDDYAYDIAVDKNGNIYSTGLFQSSVDFNPDPDEQNIHTADGYSDAFLVKYDKYGNFQWAKSWGGEDGDDGKSIDIDGAGNIYVGGRFRSTADFNPGDGSDLRTSNGDFDCFLARYMPNGDYIGVVTWGGSGFDDINRIYTDSFGNVCATGFFEGTVDFDPDPVREEIYSSHGWLDVFISKFYSTGVLHWARAWGAPDNGYSDEGNGVVCNSIGNVYCSGEFSGICDFDPGSGSDIHSPAGGDYKDAFLSSFDSNGNFQWAHTWGSTYQDEAQECTVDEYDDIYVVGDFYYTVDFNPDLLETEERTAVWESDVFVSKFAPDGDFILVFTWGGGGLDYARCISISSDYFWVLGEWQWQTGSELCNLGRLDNNGNKIWGRWWIPDLTKAGLDVDSEGISYICGWYNRDDKDFDPGPGKWYPPNYVGNWDCYIMKLLPNGYWE